MVNPKSYKDAVKSSMEAKERKAKRQAKAAELWPDAPNKPRRKKSLYRRLRDQLDKECQAYARDRDLATGCRIGKAQGCTGKSEVGYHIVPRSAISTRWDLDFMSIGNIVGACNRCNFGENYHRLAYADHHRKIFGADFYEALTAKSREQVKYSSLELQAMLEDVRHRRSELKLEDGK